MNILELSLKWTLTWLFVFRLHLVSGLHYITILYGSWWNIIQQPLHSLGRCKAYGYWHDTKFATGRQIIIWSLKQKYGMAWLKVQYIVIKYPTVNLLHSSCLLKLRESIENYTFVYIPLCIVNFGHCKLHFCQHRCGLSPQEIDGNSFWMIVGIHGTMS